MEPCPSSGRTLGGGPASGRLGGLLAGIAFVRLGLPDGGEDVWRQLEARADELDSAPAAPDYFATSLPELLLFNTDTAASRGAAAAHLRQLAGQGRLLAAHAGTKERAAL